LKDLRLPVEGFAAGGTLNADKDDDDELEMEDPDPIWRNPF
jgi:hypothetical protein